MAVRQAESVIKNIIKEITIEASRQGQNVSETLAAFLVKAAVLNPDQDFSSERALTKSDVQQLISICVNMLMSTQSPAMDTIRMQVHFDMNYSKRVDFLDEHRHMLEERLQPILREITDTRARSKEEIDILFRKVVSYILLRSGLGSPTDILVVKEASAALQSVLPPSELGTFMVLSKAEKVQQLAELTHICTGIRLFNKECGKGGAGIDDLSGILRDAIQTTSEQLEFEMSHTLKYAYELTAALVHVIDSPLPPPPESTIKDMKESLINARQHQAFLKILMADVLTCAEQLDKLEGEFRMKMESLRTTVQTKTAVPTSQVYPLFIAVSQIWCGFQDEVVLLSVLSSLLTSLAPFTKNTAEIVARDEIKIVVNQSVVLSDEQRRIQKSNLEDRVDVTAYRKAEFLFPENIKNFNQLPLEFNTFCAHMVGVHNGVIVPGNPSIGVLQYRGKYYAFSNREAADAFANEPEKHLSMSVNAGKRNPELIHLLGMHSHLAPLRNGKMEGLIVPPVMKADAGTQTDTHPMESNIVKSYEWNEWELRRKAIKLANLRQKLTHSTQTDLSHYRRENDTQVYLSKTKESQTRSDHATSVPKPAMFMAGLRGKDIKPQKVELTLDVATHNNIHS